MNKRLQEYLNQKAQEEFYIKEAQKRKLLLREGLFDLQYSDEWSEGASWDSESGKYIIEVPIQITDEEYQALKEACSTNNTSYKEVGYNGIANALKVIAWIIFIGGFVGGILSGSATADYYSDFNFVVAFAVWALALVSGTSFLGFAEIINLLEGIKAK